MVNSDVSLAAALAGGALLGAAITIAGAAYHRLDVSSSCRSRGASRDLDSHRDCTACTPEPAWEPEEQKQQAQCCEHMHHEEEQARHHQRDAATGVSRDQHCGAFANAISLISPVDAKKRSDPYDCGPRTGYLQWDDYFMSVAFLSAQRSKDPNKQVGAVIVSADNIILSIGYNGFPRGCPDEKLPWAKKSRSGNVLDTKYPYVVHAEANALLNKNQASVAGARVYVTMFPCNECAKLLIQAGILEVVYHESKAESVKHHPALTSPLNGDSSCTASRTNSSSSFPAASAQVAPAPEEEDPDMQAFSFSTGNGSGGGGSGGGCCSPDAAHVAVGAPDAGYIASRRLLTMAGVKLRQHKLKQLIVVNPGC